MGIKFGMSVPFAHVVRYKGRCYLHNGFQRAYGARQAGATHIPCLFSDVGDWEAVGLKHDNSTFQPDVMEAPNPPTVAHFTQGRAYPVALRIFSRFIHVSWSEFALPEE
jgi:hypothetical protein